jgi:hypothetical protein
MTFHELELELVRRGLVWLSMSRRDGLWQLVAQSHGGAVYVSVEIDLEVAVRKVLDDHDAKYAASLCVGRA